ncbi:hypothetical protein [Candidatus Thiosymbion oneisti]|uniref:hypothetical protein n=1 Tax=Candidatus Thiosymbion oneisti TaxID=589554 RepID=UPI001060DE7E|nr:hypothetical protein [Candidatus Thiosymbion oneisti]
MGLWRLAAEYRRADQARDGRHPPGCFNEPVGRVRSGRHAGHPVSGNGAPITAANAASRQARLTRPTPAHHTIDAVRRRARPVPGASPHPTGWIEIGIAIGIPTSIPIPIPISGMTHPYLPG